MDNINRERQKDYINVLCRDIQEQYTIDEKLYQRDSIKRGLRNADGTGVTVGISGIGSVQGYYMEDGEKMPMPGQLYYRGIAVTDIADAHQKAGTFGYEEVAYLLLLGKLPTKDQFDYFNTVLAKTRPLPEGFFEDMILKTASSNIMNMLSRCVLALYAYDPDPEDLSIENLTRQSIELIARFPGIVATAYAAKRHQHDHKSLYIHNPKEELSVSENFLRMIRKDKTFTREEALLLDLMLILHAEHGGGNNSTFACRTISSTGADTYSAIAGAVGSLKGPLHGGANAKVMEMFDYIKKDVPDTTDEDELRKYINKILDGEAADHSGKIYGLGHAVYTVSDPRAVMIKKYAKDIAEEKGKLADFELVETVERIGIEELCKRKGKDVQMCANVDMYSGMVYSMLGIPAELYTPLFAMARISGWCAHRIEEIYTAKRIMRPAYRALHIRQPYVEMQNRHSNGLI